MSTTRAILRVTEQDYPMIEYEEVLITFWMYLEVGKEGRKREGWGDGERVR